MEVFPNLELPCVVHLKETHSRSSSCVICTAWVSFIQRPDAANIKPFAYIDNWEIVSEDVEAWKRLGPELNPFVNHGSKVDL